GGAWCRYLKVPLHRANDGCRVGSSWGRIAAAAVVLVVTGGVAGATVVPAVALFDAPAQFGLGTGPSKGLFPAAIAAGDVSGDGIADLVTANRNSGNASVLPVGPLLGGGELQDGER